MDDVDLYDALLTTRAMRRFSDEPVDRKAIEACLRAAVQAPSGGNIQPWHFVVVSDRFDGAYVLRFVGDQLGEPDVLYVSEDVKRQFYANKDRIEIRAV